VNGYPSPPPESRLRNVRPPPPKRRFSCRRRRVFPSPAASRLCGDLASGSGQRLWMSIAGSSSIRRLEDVAIESALARARPSRWAGRGMRVARMATGTGIAGFADVPYCQRREPCRRGTVPAAGTVP
jgi:hypothetical protein